MKIYTFKQRLILKTLPGLAAGILKLLVKSLRVDLVRGEKFAPGRTSDRRYLYGLWHNEILPSTGYFRNTNNQSMASQSFDGEVIARALVHLGFPEPARGSSSRGGASALKSLAVGINSFARGAVLTPDGPRGPRHQVQPGIVTLAKLTGLEVVPVAFRSKPVIRLKGWDRMEIPWPFARCIVMFGDPIKIERRMNEKQFEKTRLELQEKMNSLTVEAEKLLEAL